MPTLYLLDSNVLIAANAAYYQVGRIPHFWAWIASLARRNQLKIPQVIYDEITPSRRDTSFLGWLKTNAQDLTLAESHTRSTLERVLRQGYGFAESDIAAGDSAEMENDALLVALALSSNTRCVVTLEGRQRAFTALPNPANRRIPLVCDLLGVRCIDTFDLIRELDFRIPLAS